MGWHFTVFVLLSSLSYHRKTLETDIYLFVYIIAPHKNKPPNKIHADAAISIAVMIFPNEWTFTAVDTGREKEIVWLLQLSKNSKRRHFFWSLESDADTAKDKAKALGKYLKEPSSIPAAGAGAAGAAGGGLPGGMSQAQLLQMLGGGGAGGASGIDPALLQQLMGGAGGGGGGAGGAGGASRSAAPSGTGAAAPAASRASTALCLRFLPLLR